MENRSDEDAINLVRTLAVIPSGTMFSDSDILGKVICREDFVFQKLKRISAHLTAIDLTLILKDTASVENLRKQLLVLLLA